MPQQVLLYGSVNSYSAKQFVTELSALSGKEKEVHINGDGGEVKYGLACLTNLAASDNITLINDAEANSMFAFMFCYPAKSKKCADFATFGFHRAAYPDWYENDHELFDDESKAELAKKNATLRAAMEGTVDSVKWMQETGCSMDELFSMNGRKEVIVDAQKAQRLGLVNEIMQVTPEKRKEVNALRQKIEAKFSTPAPEAENTPTQNQIKKIMTVAEFKAANPEGYNEIVTAERERCEVWAMNADVDPKAVVEGIASGKHVSAKQQAEFIRKQISAEMATKVEAENAPDLKLGAKKEEEKTGAAKVQEAAVEAVRKSLNLPA